MVKICKYPCLFWPGFSPTMSEFGGCLTFGISTSARPHGEIEGRHAARVACAHLRLGLQEKLRSREVTRQNTWDMWRLAVNVGQVGWAENLRETQWKKQTLI